MSNKKNIVVIAIVCLVLVAVFVVFCRATKLVATYPKGEQTATTTVWGTYHDSKYHFTVDYFSNLSVYGGGDGVTFGDESGMWMSEVRVIPTSFKSPEEAVAAQNKKITDSYADYPLDPETIIPIILIDAHLTVAGYPAIATHSKNSEGPDYPFPDTVLFIKDGYLFTISDRTNGFEHTWKSFHFEE